jgi:glucose/arabinose dehydrogenase
MMRFSRFFHLIIQFLLPLVLYLAGCAAPDPFPPRKQLAPPELHVTPVLDNLSFAVKMAMLPDGRMLLTEKETGRVRLITPSFDLKPQPVVDVAVNYASERGLLGIAAHPDFSRNGYVYIFYMASATDADSDAREHSGPVHIARFHLDANSVAGHVETLLTLPSQPGPYHNGGCIRFGPDGKLYVSLGELNRNINAVSLLKGSLRGKILRYNDDGSVPADNPFGPTNPVYIYGVRNVFGFAFDLQDKGIFVSDNGPRGHDRLARARAGENLGWPLIWGTVDRWYERPIAWWFGKSYRRPFWESFADHVVPTAVQVLPDDHFGVGMKGRVLMTAFGQGRILQFTLDRATGIATGLGTWVKGLTRLVDLQFAPDGNLYALTTDRLYRIEPAAERQVQ